MDSIPHPVAPGEKLDHAARNDPSDFDTVFCVQLFGFSTFPKSCVLTIFVDLHVPWYLRYFVLIS